ncbi:MAG: DNA translocase FtsK 4TM domain-containing protein, partial [Rhodocyclaceae bacterium]|nr:DNA translocase FtsK 4TM domain-containing protein [Rhodocyclaceae bacterium]
MAERNLSQPLPEKIAALVHEARWLCVAALAAFLALILWGFDKADPGWSHAALAPNVVNPGGKFGAWLADLMLYLFGLSAWWWVACLLLLLAWGYRRLGFSQETNRRHLSVVLCGFIVLLVASSGVESLRFWSLKVALPFQPGGMLGHGVSNLALQYLGFTGGTLILLTLFALGLSLFAGVSWINFVERFGFLLERIYLGSISAWQTRQDKKIGRAVAEQREALVETELKRVEANPPPPVRIEPIVQEVPLAKKAEARIEKERQAPLFFDAPGGALPPLHLLAEPVHNPDDMPSADTLEFTSRLIERKLADFGVVVQVLAAFPGPVVTRYEIEPATGVKGSQIVNLAKDLARALSLVSIRVVETVP